jgi:hypothetical protein
MTSQDATQKAGWGEEYEYDSPPPSLDLTQEQLDYVTRLVTDYGIVDEYGLNLPPGNIHMIIHSQFRHCQFTEPFLIALSQPPCSF